MSRRIDSTGAVDERRRTRQLPVRIATLAAVAAAVAATLVALSGAVAGITRAPDLAVRADAGYQIRCWQFGRLLFEETGVQLPANAAGNGLKLRGYDRRGAPVYVTETENATCLVRREPADPAPQRGYRSVP